MQTSIRLNAELLEWLSALRDGQNLPSHAEALRVAILKAYPNIEDIVQLARKKAEERNAALLKEIIDEEKSDNV